MKKILIVLSITLIAQYVFSQSQSLPAVTLKDLDGKDVNTATLSNDGKPMLICFWATWCKPCIQELQTYHGIYDEWKQKYGAKLIAVSIDDSRNAQKVAPFIKSRNWQYDVLLDINQDFKRAMNVNNVPHTFVIMNGKVVFSHAAYTAGDEEELEELLKKLSGKE